MSNKPTKEEALKAVETLISWAGDDPTREGLIETPDRVIRAYKEFFAGYEEDPEQVLTKTFEEVDLIVSHTSDLGMNLIINKRHLGLIFKDDIFKDLSIGDKLKGIVKKIRPSNKIDISLSQICYRNIEPSAQSLLDFINDNNGFLDITDKSSPEVIREVVQMSKKTFKKALGTLYKKRLVRLETDGIYLVNK